MHVVHAPLELGVPTLVQRLRALGGTQIGESVTDLSDAIGTWWQVMAAPRTTSSASSPTRVTRHRSQGVDDVLDARGPWRHRRASGCCS
jgi:hypothetical protein